MLTRAKVGEWTDASIPRPRARPLTSCVLPAPRSPQSPITSPDAIVRPHASPSATVSEGLCEMFVTMNGQWSHPMLVADGDGFSPGNFTDATQAKVRKLLLPAIQQGDRVAAGQSKQQLEILAVGQRCLQCWLACA